MHRFIDIRGQGADNRFCFWDTCSSRFIEIQGQQAWDDFEDLASYFDKPDHSYLERLKSLCPEWVFLPAPEDEYGVPYGNAEGQSFWMDHEELMEQAREEGRNEIRRSLNEKS